MCVCLPVGERACVGWPPLGGAGRLDRPSRPPPPSQLCPRPGFCVLWWRPRPGRLGVQWSCSGQPVRMTWPVSVLLLCLLPPTVLDFSPLPSSLWPFPVSPQHLPYPPLMVPLVGGLAQTPAVPRSHRLPSPGPWVGRASGKPLSLSDTVHCHSTLWGLTESIQTDRAADNVETDVLIREGASCQHQGLGTRTWRRSRPLRRPWGSRDPRPETA